MNPVASTSKIRPLVVALVGAILPDGALADYPAASQPGQMFQHGVLNALRDHGIDTSVISLRPVSSYPRSRRVCFRGGDGVLTDNIPYRQIGFINAGPIKTLTAGLTSFIALWRWARQHRDERRLMLFYNAYNPSAWVGIVAARLTGSKVVTIVADVRVPGSGGGTSLLRRIEYKLAVASLRHVDALVSVTRRIAADFAAGVPLLFLDGGVGDDMLAPLPITTSASLLEARPLEDKQFVALYAGS